MCVAGQGSSPTPSTASIVGFSVVLSFLIIALCIVVLLCVCFGKCRLPCKPLPRTHDIEPAASERDRPQRSSNRRQLVPQPSPKNVRVRPSSLDNATSVEQPVREHRYTSLPPSVTLAAAMPPLSTSPQLLFRGDSTVAQNPQQLMDAVSTLPTSSSSNKVVHLSQINAESFKKITKNDIEYSQRNILPVRSATSNPHHQRRAPEQAKSTSTGLTPNRTAGRPIPESGLPYQPQKLPFTPRGYSMNTSSHSFPGGGAARLSHPIPYLSSAAAPVGYQVAAQDDSPPLQDTTADEISSRSTHDTVATGNQSHQTQRQTRQDEGGSSKVSSSAATAKTPPISYSTVV